MIQGVQRTRGRELSDMANVMCVAFRGSADSMSKLHGMLENFGVQFTPREIEQASEAATQKLVDTLLRVIPMAGPNDG